MQQSDRVRPAYFFKRRCKVQKKMTWHLGTGLKGEPYLCFECLTERMTSGGDIANRPS